MYNSQTPVETPHNDSYQRDRLQESPIDLHIQNYKYQSFQRKVSRRRQIQEEKGIIVDLFKELMGKINEGYGKYINLQNQKNNLSRQSKNPKPKLKNKISKQLIQTPKEKHHPKRNLEEEKLRLEKKKNMLEQERKRIKDQKKLSIFVKYEVLMNYQVMEEEKEEPINQDEKMIEENNLSQPKRQG